MSDGGTAEFLATVPLFEGRDQADLAELARVMRRRTLRAGDTLWRQGDEAREMVFVVEGRVAASMRVAGDRSAETGSAGPGEMAGEIAMLDGGAYPTTVTVTEPARVLALGRLDLAALLARQHPSAFSLRRRLARHLTRRLRDNLARLAGSAGHEVTGPPADDGGRAFADLEYCGPPDSAYVRRMATFHDFDPLAVWGFLTSGRYARCEPGRTLLAEGAPSPACFLTINGAVEKLMVRGDRRVRVGLAGPGKAFGYEGLIDGRPSPVTAIARERVLLLVLARDPFEQLFRSEDPISRVFLDVVQRDILAALRQTIPPLARRATALPVEAVLEARPAR
jgi:CRP-like cAMP-binding protein